MVASVQADTHPNLSSTTLDEQHRRMEGRDGIREDYTGGAFDVTLSTSAKTFTVALAGRSMLVDGNLLDFSGLTVDPTFTPADAGVVPTGTQVRTDLVVARYDDTVEPIVDRGRVVIRPGNPGTTSATPTPVRTPAGVWEVPIASYVYPATGGLLTTKRDLRWWAGDHAYLSSLGDLHGPVGCTRDYGGSLWRRRLVGGAPTWVQEVGGPVERIAADSFSATFSVTSPGRTLCGTIDVPAKSYARTLDAYASVLAVTFAGADAQLDLGFRLIRAGVIEADRNRLARITPTQPGVSGHHQQFDIDPGVTYALQLWGEASRGTNVTNDRRFTGMTAVLRGRS